MTHLPHPKHIMAAMILSLGFGALVGLWWVGHAPRDRVHAASVTWDGGGTDGSCGGSPGDGNKWSCAANWSGDQLPGTGDVATFDNTSSKDVTIDSALDVQGIDINSGYTGTLTQAASISLGSGGFAQDAGVFVGGTQTIDLNDGDFTLGAGADFTSTSGTLSVERSLTIDSSATFDANGGTFSFDGTGNDDDGGLSCGGQTFASILIQKNDPGADLTIGSDCTLDLGNNPTSTAGVIDNQGDVTVGTGTWTLHASYVQTQASGALTLGSTTWDVNARGGSSGNPGGLDLGAGSLSATSLTTLSVQGDLDNSVDLLPTGLDLTLDGTDDDSTLTCSDNEAWANLTINKTGSGITTLDCSATVSGDFVRTDGVVGNATTAETLGVQGALTLSGTDGFGGSNLTLALTGGSNQSITQGALTLSAHWLINKSGGTATLATNLTNSGATCTLVEGKLRLAGFDLSCGGVFAVEDGGTLQLNGDESVSAPGFATGSTAIFEGDGDTQQDDFALPDWSYDNLVMQLTDGADNLDASAISVLTVDGDISLLAGEFVAPSVLELGGNWSNGATFTHDSQTVRLVGADQQINDSNTFFHLTKNVTSASTLTFEAGTTQTVAGTLTLSGASGELLSLRSSTTDSAWSIDPQGGRTISYLDVKDSTNLSATEIETFGLNITDSDGNTGWDFTVPPGAPVLSNADYGVLRILIDQNGNAATAEYAIAVSTDDFVSDTRYVQSDTSLGTTLGEEDWQTYADWGGSTGVSIGGLTDEQIYYVKVKARDSGESDYGSTANLATWQRPALALSVEGTDLGSVDLVGLNKEIVVGYLVPGTPATAVQKLSVTTNATSGYRVEIMADQKMQLSGDASVDVDFITNGTVGTNTTPVAWTAPTGTTIGEDTAFIGYHTSDATLGTGTTDRFAAADTWAGFDTLGQFYEVLYLAGPTEGSDEGEEFTYLTFKIQTNNLHPSGNYSSLVVKYRAVPLY